MKTKFKTVIKIVAALGIIALICILLLLFPKAAQKVSDWTGIAYSTLQNTLVTVAGIAIGGMLISFGVTALAAVPIVGIVLVAVGLIILGWSLYNSGWFSSNTVPINSSKLNKVA